MLPSLLEAAEVAIREREKVAAGFDLSVSVKITCYANQRRFYTTKTDTYSFYTTPYISFNRLVHCLMMA